MQYIKYASILIFQLLMFQFAAGQSAVAVDENGRSIGASANVKKVEKNTEKLPQNKDVFNGSDFDIPGNYKQRVAEDVTEYEFPVDLDILREEMNASTAVKSVALMEKLNTIAEQLETLSQANEALRMENKIIRKSFESCCSGKELGLSASDAYLMQNAPNPFNGSSEIKYFIPKDMQNVRLEIKDMKGITVQSHTIQESGLGKIDVEINGLTNGTYLYILLINEEVVDSKVMILNN